jgi:hypothetical protein
VRWRQDLELQRVGDPVDQAEGKGDLREVADRLVTHAGGAQALEVARRDRIGAGGEGGQEPQRGVRPRVTSGAVAQCLLDGLAIARLARVLGVTGDAELARFWVETKAANSSRSAKYYTVTHWRMAWVGFGIVELVAFTATAWAFWRAARW